MNTPAHLIFGLTAFGDPQRKALIVAALSGALIPDLSLYLLAGWELVVQGTPAQVVFGEMYYSQSWQSIFRIDNSFILWGIALVVALMTGARIAIAFCGAGLLHLVLDFPLHHDDGRAHFWPVTDWIFMSPLSYWDAAHYGTQVGIVAILAVLVCCLVLWRRYKGWNMRAVFMTIALFETAPAILFGLLF